MPTSPKPKHQAVHGRVRITLFRGIRKPATFTIERRRDDQSDDWYPAAGFPLDDLASLEKAVAIMKEHLATRTPKRANNARAAQPTTHPTATSATLEEPPFTPNRPMPSMPDQPATPIPATLKPETPNGATTDRKPLTRSVSSRQSKSRSGR